MVIGAGAAGLLAAITAARSGASVTLLESTPDGGRKILIAGGGRCNILPSVPAPERFVTSSSPNTLRKILRSWPLDEQIEFFERELDQRLIREPDTGKLFPESNRARDVRDRLVVRAREAGVEFTFGCRVVAIEAMPTTPSQSGSKADSTGTADWTVTSANGHRVLAGAVIVATGGRSVPKTGSDGWGLDWLARLGVQVHETYPALTPLVADPAVHAQLAGVSLNVSIRVPGQRPALESSGGFLFTHRGYSGPAVLDVSHAAVRSGRSNRDQEVLVAWGGKGDQEWEAGLHPESASASGSGRVSASLVPHLPKRLAETLLSEAGVSGETQLAQLTRDQRRALVQLLSAYRLPWTGDEGYKKAEVTGGGVALSEIDPRSMEAKGHPGLFLCGEVLDAFGPIGGHNFMWAWATGRAAGRGAAQRLARSDVPV